MSNLLKIEKKDSKSMALSKVMLMIVFGFCILTAIVTMVFSFLSAYKLEFDDNTATAVSTAGSVIWGSLMFAYELLLGFCMVVGANAIRIDDDKLGKFYGRIIATLAVLIVTLTFLFALHVEALSIGLAIKTQ